MLVKPQFELPDRRVKAAGADTARLREEALDKVRERAERARVRGRRALRFAGGGRQRHRGGPRPPALRRAPRLDAAAGRAQAPPPSAARAPRPARCPRRCAGSPSSRPGWKTSRATRSRRCRTSSEVARRDGRRRLDRPAGERAAARTCGRASRRACSRASARWRRASSASCGAAPRACPGAPFVAPGRVGRGARQRQPLPPLPHGRAGRGGGARGRATPCRARAPAKRDEDGRRDVARPRRRRSVHVQRRRVGRAAAPPRRAHRDGRGAAARDAGGRPARAGGLAAGDARWSIRCAAPGRSSIEAAMQALGRAPGAERALRDGALAARDATPTHRAGAGGAARRSAGARRRRSRRRAAGAQSSAPTATRA